MPKRDVITHDSILLLAVIVEPALTLALDPHAFALDAILVEVDALTVLLALVPAAFIDATVWPGENTVALLLIVNISADVLPSIFPREDAFTMHAVS